MKKRTFIMGLAALALAFGSAGVIGGVSLGANSGAIGIKAADGDEHAISYTETQTLLNNGNVPDSISIKNQGYPVKQVIIGWKHNKSRISITANVQIGNNVLGSGSIGGTDGTSTTTIGSGGSSLEGAITISFSSTLTGTGKGTLYIQSIILVEGESKTPNKIEITSGLDSVQKEYDVGDVFDPTGLVVTATYDSGETADVSQYVVWPSDPLTEGTTCVTGTYAGFSVTVDGLIVSVPVNKNTFKIEGYYTISHTKNKETYYLQGNGTSSAPSAVTDYTKATIFLFELTADDTFTIKTTAGNYLYATDTNNGLRVGTTKHTWKIAKGTKDSGSYDISSTTFTSRFVSLYSTQDFRVYANNATNRTENTDLNSEKDPSVQTATFGKTFLNVTSEPCSAENDRETKLSAAWDDLKNIFESLNVEIQNNIKSATADNDGTDIEKALCRYDYILNAHPSLTDFIGRGTNSASAAKAVGFDSSEKDNVNLTIVITCSTLAAALSATFVLRKKKQDR